MFAEAVTGSGATMSAAIAVLGDLHLGRHLYGYDLTPHIRRTMYRFLRFCLAKGAGAVVQLGDVFDSSTPKEEHRKALVQWCNEFRGHPFNLFLMTGNHDVSSNKAAPSALETLRCLDLEHVTIVDRPMYIPGQVSGVDPGKALRLPMLFLPFPSPGIYQSFDEYLDEIPDEVDEDTVVFSHLNVEGAKLGDQEFLYRGGDYYLPLLGLTTIAGHIHKPQSVRGGIEIVGAAQRLRFDESLGSRWFTLVDDRGVRRYRTSALGLATLEIDVSGLSHGGSAISTEEAIAMIDDSDVGGKLIKLVPYVDDSSMVNWEDVRASLYAAGAAHVVMAPPVKMRREKEKRRRKLVDPVEAATGFVRDRVKCDDDRKVLVKMFKQLLVRAAR